MGKRDKDKDKKRVKQSQRDAKAADKAGDRAGHHGAKAHGQPAKVDASLPSSRDELLALHAAARRRRAAAPYNTPEHHAAIDEIGRIEVRIADVEQATPPPRG
jgi:hypothetical protein